MGSIENCSYCHPAILSIADKISHLKDKVDILSLSSVGPSFFAITKKNNTAECEEIFREAGLSTTLVDLENETYSIINKY